jgi:tRNA pseudouridine55 synthase
MHEQPDVFCPTQSSQFQCGDIVNIDKPLGLTSFQVVKRIRRWTGCRKVGHAGTLDPMATGVLLICTGKATKKVAVFMELMKTYEGEILLGQTTDTDDADGRIIQESSVPLISESQIRLVLNEYLGEIEQVPPQYSAIRRNGTRMYHLARKGFHVPAPPRHVLIDQISLLSWENPRIRIRVRCGKGTYIRSLARDIGKQLGTGGHLSQLRRTAIGPYYVDEAWPLEQFKKAVLNDEGLSIV